MAATLAPAPPETGARATTPVRAERPAGHGRFTTVARATHDVLGWLLAASATLLSASGQIEYAIDADITDLRRFLVPAILEIAAIFLILGGYLRACDGDSPAMLWLLAAVVTGFATWTNLSHGGPRAGRIYAAATIVTFVLWLLKLRDRYRAARRASGLIDAPTAKFRLIRWLVMPRLTGRAWLLAVEYGLRDADDALARARLWHDTARETGAATTGTPKERREAAHRAAALAVRRVHVVSSTPAPVTAAATVFPDPSSDTADAVNAGPDDVSPEPAGKPFPEPTPGKNTPDGAHGHADADTPASVPADAAPVPEHDDEVAGPDLPTTRGVPLPDAAQPHLAVPHVPAEASPVPSAGTPTSSRADPYQPTSEEDAVMYRTWLQGINAGHEPSGADLARAAGRPDDTSAIGRRAARRYRDAHHNHRRAGGAGRSATHNEYRLSSTAAGR
jgi:hypothetical protein